MGIFSWLSGNAGQVTPTHHRPKKIASAIQPRKEVPAESTESAETSATYTEPSTSYTPTPTSYPTEPDTPDKSFDTRLKEANGSLEDLEGLWDDTDSTSSDAAKVLAAVETLDESVSDLMETYSNRSGLDGFSEILLKKAITSAKTPENWICVWNEVQDDDDGSKKVAKALSKATFSQTEWEEIRNDADSTSLESFAFIKLLDLYRDPPSTAQFYLDSVEDWDLEPEVEKAIFAKLFSLCTRQEVQLIDILTDKEPLRDAATEFLKS